jgi:hypothetical protein
MGTTVRTVFANKSCGCESSPLARKKSNAPSRKKSLKNYAPVKKGSGVGSKAGGGMTAKGVKAYKKKNPGSKLKTAVLGLKAGLQKEVERLDVSGTANII